MVACSIELPTVAMVFIVVAKVLAFHDHLFHISATVVVAVVFLSTTARIVAIVPVSHGMGRRRDISQWCGGVSHKCRWC